MRLAATVTAAASVLVGKAMIAAGLRRPPEGWRRTVGILLRSEATRFALSAFGLRVPRSASSIPAGQAFRTQTAHALQTFLATEPDAHFALDWLHPITRRRRTGVADLVVLEFAADGNLDGIAPHLASGAAAPPPDIRAHVHDAIVKAYNETSHEPEVDPGGVRRRLTSAAPALSGRR